MAERVLVTGATGKTGSALVRRLRAANVTVRAGTRTPRAPGDVRFDWRDPASFEAALADADGIYLVAPVDTVEQLAVMRPFLEAAARGGRRLVLLSASSLPEGGPMMGAVHRWLAGHAERWMALRPSWFMQNFVGQHRDSIVRDGAIYSATGSGRVAFIDAEDIAAVAAATLIGTAFENGSAPILTGPETLSYDEVADMITTVSGRSVRHVRLSAADLARRYQGFGLPQPYAELLAAMDHGIADGAEDRTTGEVERLTGRPPNDLARFLETHRDALR